MNFLIQLKMQIYLQNDHRIMDAHWQRLTDEQAEDIERGKDFVQLRNGPFDLGLVFAPDGIERFEEAWQRHIEIEGFSICHIDDIIASKEAANRVKDRESLPRLLETEANKGLKNGILQIF